MPLALLLLFRMKRGVRVPGCPVRVLFEGLHHVELGGEVVDLLPLEGVQVGVFGVGRGRVDEALEDAAG